jgi:hypothetical protein
MARDDRRDLAAHFEAVDSEEGWEGSVARLKLINAW